MSSIWKSSVLMVLSVFGGGSHPGFLPTGGGALVALADVIADKNDVDENGGVRGAIVTEEVNTKTVKLMQVAAIKCQNMSDDSSTGDQVKLYVNGKLVNFGSLSMKAGDIVLLPDYAMKMTEVILEEKPRICLKENDWGPDDDLGCVAFDENKFPFGRYKVHFTSTSEPSSYYLYVTVTEHVTEKVKTKICRWNGCGLGGCRSDETQESESGKNCCWICGNNEYCCRWIYNAEDLDTSIYPEVY